MRGKKPGRILPPRLEGTLALAEEAGAGDVQRF
jgi:hypothetical protein